MAQTVCGVVARKKGEPVEVVDVLIPEPGPREVVVDVTACGVCHTDLTYREGGINDEYPFLLGHEAAGTLAEPGAMRTDWAGSSMAVAQRSPDYAPTVGAMAARLRAANDTEPIDPHRVARAFVQIAELNDPPLHLLLGSDAVDLAAAGLQKTFEEDQQCAQLGRSVDFDAR
jgi:hypothetical protein